MHVENPAGGIAHFVEHILPYVKAGVIVDTGSSDKTVEILNEKKNEYTNLYIYTIEFTTFAKARNTCLQYALQVQKKLNILQPYVLFLDADERISVCYIKKIEEMMHIIKFPQCIKFTIQNILQDKIYKRSNSGLWNPRIFPLHKNFYFIDTIQGYRFERLLCDLSNGFTFLSYKKSFDIYPLHLQNKLCSWHCSYTVPTILHFLPSSQRLRKEKNRKYCGDIVYYKKQYLQKIQSAKNTIINETYTRLKWQLQTKITNIYIYNNILQNLVQCINCNISNNSGTYISSLVWWEDIGLCSIVQIPSISKNLDIKYKTIDIYSGKCNLYIEQELYKNQKEWDSNTIPWIQVYNGSIINTPPSIDFFNILIKFIYKLDNDITIDYYNNNMVSNFHLIQMLSENLIAIVQKISLNTITIIQIKPVWTHIITINPIVDQFNYKSYNINNKYYINKNIIQDLQKVYTQYGILQSKEIIDIVSLDTTPLPIEENSNKSLNIQKVFWNPVQYNKALDVYKYNDTTTVSYPAVIIDACVFPLCSTLSSLLIYTRDGSQWVYKLDCF